jgi:hypothetical protein
MESTFKKEKKRKKYKGWVKEKPILWIAYLQK